MDGHAHSIYCLIVYSPLLLKADLLSLSEDQSSLWDVADFSPLLGPCVLSTAPDACGFGGFPFSALAGCPSCCFALALSLWAGSVSTRLLTSVSIDWRGLPSGLSALRVRSAPSAPCALTCGPSPWPPWVLSSASLTGHRAAAGA